MRRLTDNDRKFGLLTYARSSWNPWRLVLSSGGGDDDDGDPVNTLTAYAFGWVARIDLPSLISPFKVKHMATSWDAATVARLGRNWYFETFPRKFGFCLNDGHFILYLGAQTHDSTTTQSWSCFLPWTEWRHIRFSLYDTTGAHFWTQFEAQRKNGSGRFKERMDAEDECPSITFAFNDFDGERITATTRIEEREWRLGTGWFKWLSLFCKRKIRRSLDIDFSSEVGPEKGSWKGGTTGHGIEMLPGELHEAAFRRYCEQEQRSKYRPFRLTFIGPT